MDTQLCKAKLLNSNTWITGFYASKQETTYCFKEDYDRNPVQTRHYIICDEMTDWGLPNVFREYEIELSNEDAESMLELVRQTSVRIKRNLFDKELVEIYKDLKNNRSVI